MQHFLLIRRRFSGLLSSRYPDGPFPNRPDIRPSFLLLPLGSPEKPPLFSPAGAEDGPHLFRVPSNPEETGPWCVLVLVTLKLLDCPQPRAARAGIALDLFRRRPEGFSRQHPDEWHSLALAGGELAWTAA